MHDTDTLESVSQRFLQWKEDCEYHAPIPKELWIAIISLKAKYTVPEILEVIPVSDSQFYRMAKKLCPELLKGSNLRNRSIKPLEATESLGGFVNLSLGSVSSSTDKAFNMVAQLTNSAGAELKLYLSSEAELDLVLSKFAR